MATINIFYTLVVILLLNIHLVDLRFTCDAYKNENNCKCNEFTAFFKLTCPIDDNNKVFDINFKEDYDQFEIDCKNNSIYSQSLIPTFFQYKIKNIKLYNYINCSMDEFDMIRKNLIKTTETETLSIKNVNQIIANDLKIMLIKTLHITDSPFETLPEDTLSEIRGLKKVFINRNKIKDLPENFFKQSPDLEEIDLGQNNLSNISNNLLSNLKKLKQLRIFTNNLTTLRKGTFDGLNNLEGLELMTNKLTSIDSNIFKDLIQLKDLSLRSNQFKTFPEGIFEFNTKLERVRLDYNYNLTNLPDFFLSNLTNLQNVQMNYCNLSKLPENIFWGTVNLTKLNLDNNKLSMLSKNLFVNTQKLIYLSLKNNKLEIIEEGTFSKLEKLNSLYLSNNRLKIFEKTFMGLENLKSLYLQNNNLSSLTKQSFSYIKNLVELDMSNNNLTLKSASFTEERHSVLQELQKIEILNLRNNIIPYVYNDWYLLFSSIKKLNLEYNNVNYLNYQQLQFAPGKTVEINLKNNKITIVDLSSAEVITKSNKNLSNTGSKRVLLNNNPITCGCEAYNLIRYLDGSMSEEVRKTLILDVSDITCLGSNRYEGMYIENLQSKQFICPLEDTEMPKKCRRKQYDYRPFNKRLIMNCTYSGLSRIPLFNLKDTMYENYDLEMLLEGNNITTLVKPLFIKNNVVKLDLSFNNISKIAWIPSKIEVLKLHNNNLNFINYDELSKINASSVTNLTFHNNPWYCSCKLVNFTRYLQENFKKIESLHNIKCKIDDNFFEVTTLKPEDLCPNSVYVIISITVMLVVALLLAILVAFYFRFNQQIKVWLYARNLCLYLITEEELDQDKLYDAFISFSHEDEDFVVNNLLPELEEGTHPFKLCVHFRDWQPGEFITTNIARSIDQSRRTVVVLSSGFLRSEWGRMEFRTAHTEALKEGRARVIVIVYGDIGPVDNLDPELKAYLSTNTYIKWGTPWFWDNLRYALPHSSKFNRQLNNLKTPIICQQPEKKIFDDKTDLIHEPSTPPAATTPPAESLKHLHDPLLHSALNVTLIGDTLINNINKSPNYYDIDVKIIV